EFLSRRTVERLVGTPPERRSAAEADLLLAILMLEVWLSSFLPRALHTAEPVREQVPAGPANGPATPPSLPAGTRPRTPSAWPAAWWVRRCLRRRGSSSTPARPTERRRSHERSSTIIPGSWS